MTIDVFSERKLTAENCILGMLSRRQSFLKISRDRIPDCNKTLIIIWTIFHTLPSRFSFFLRSDIFYASLSYHMSEIVQVCMHTRMHTRKHTHTHAHTQAHTQVHTHTHAHTHTKHPCTHASTRAHAHMHILQDRGLPKRMWKEQGTSRD